MKNVLGKLGLWLVLSAVAGCSADALSNGESIEAVEQATTYQNNGNRTSFSSTTAVSYPLTTVGKLSLPGGGWCSGTLIAANKVLSAAHCIGDTTPSSITFRPHGSATSATVTRIVQGRGAADTQIYADWAVLTLNSSFPNNGVMAIVIPPAPPFTVNDAGYSGDLPLDTLGVHFNCSMKFDNGNGIGNNCDLQGGASGGPLYTWPGSGTAAVYAVNSGHTGGTNVVYSDGNANTAAGAKYFAFAPDNAAGLGVAYTSNGRLQVYASDRDWSLIGSRWKVDTNASGAWTEWRALDSAFSGARKLAAVNLQDNRQEVFVVTSAGQLRTRWQTALDGAWSGWVTMATPTTIKDVATTGGSGVVTQVFVLGTDNVVYTAHKTGDSNSAFTSWCSLGSVANAQALAAVRFGGTQQIFVASSTLGIQSAFSGANACSSWSALQSLGGSAFRAVTAGTLADGRVHVTAVTSNGTALHRIRAANGSSWTSWANLGPSNPANTTGFTVLASGRLTDGREELFGVASNGEIYTTWELGGVFQGWVRFYL